MIEAQRRVSEIKDTRLDILSEIETRRNERWTRRGAVQSQLVYNEHNRRLAA